MQEGVSLTGAIGSLAFTLYTGRHNGSVLLLGLFVIWVGSPFAALIVVKALRSLALALVVTTASLAIYGTIALGPPRAQPAFFFLMTPAASWFLIGAAAFLNRRPRA